MRQNYRMSHSHPSITNTFYQIKRTALLEFIPLIDVRINIGTVEHTADIEILSPAFNAANSNCCLFWGVSALTLLFSWWNSCSIGFKSGDWLGQSTTFHFFALINSLTELAGCFGSLSWCNTKHFPINLVAFSWILVGKMVLYPSKFTLPLSSYIKSSVKLRGPVPGTAMHAHAMTPPPPCFTDKAVCVG